MSGHSRFVPISLSFSPPRERKSEHRWKICSRRMCGRNSGANFWPWQTFFLFYFTLWSICQVIPYRGQTKTNNFTDLWGKATKVQRKLIRGIVLTEPWFILFWWPLVALTVNAKIIHWLGVRIEVCCLKWRISVTTQRAAPKHHLHM